MGVKNVVAGQLEKAKEFADSVRAVYDSAYSKAMDMRKDSLNGLINDIQPKVRAAVENGIHGAQTALDDFNQALADKAVPAFRKGAVAKEQFNQKTEKVKRRAGQTGSQSAAKKGRAKSPASVSKSSRKPQAKK